ncbi:MAG: hypothetical protein WBD22_07700, partial [Pyrinomonadaceae bacterium]
VCICSITTISQEQEPAAQAQLWHSRAETISANLLRETTAIGELDRALLFAELGDAWWNSDPEQADTWFVKSVDFIFFYSPEKVGSNTGELLEATRKILILLANRNKKQTARLIKIISDVEHSSDKDKNSNSDALVTFALQIVPEEPVKAYQIGEIALRIGTPRELYKLIWELNRNNQPLAVKLFNNAILKARTEPSYYRLQVIQVAAFPETIASEVREHWKLQRAAKVASLRLFADIILQLQAKFLVKQIETCTAEASLVAKLKNQYIEFLPEQIGPVIQAINVCLDGQSARTRSLTDTIQNSSVEELLKLADEHKGEPVLRTAYLYRAALLAHEEKRYELCIDILIGMDEKERSADVEFWEDLRSSAASFLAYKKYNEQDIQGANKVLDDVPVSIRAFAQYGFVKQFPKDESSSLPFRLEILNDAKINFTKSDKTFYRKSTYWFSLVGLLSQHGNQNEASDVFREIVKSFNDEQNEKSSIQIDIGRDMAHSAFSSELIDAMGPSIFETVKLISKPRSRINVNFVLLKVALGQLDRFNQARPIRDRKSKN